MTMRVEIVAVGTELLLGEIAILAVSLPIFHSYAALIPMLFPRIVIFLIGILPQKQKEV